jgi:hypothetical protein
MKRFLNYLLNKQWILYVVMCFLSEEKKERIYIAKLRAELALWGYDTSEMTDDEIKDGLMKVNEVSIQCGVTKQELAEVLKAMANCT